MTIEFVREQAPVPQPTPGGDGDVPPDPTDCPGMGGDSLLETIRVAARGTLEERCVAEDEAGEQAKAEWLDRATDRIVEEVEAAIREAARERANLSCATVAVIAWEAERVAVNEASCPEGTRRSRGLREARDVAFAEAVVQTPDGRREPADLAETERTRIQGQRGRDPVRPMAFRFPEAGRYAFEMRGVPVDLEIVYLDAEDRVAQIDVMRAETGRSRPARPVRTAIEAPIGWADRRGLELGDRIKIERGFTEQQDCQAQASQAFERWVEDAINDFSGGKMPQGYVTRTLNEARKGGGPLAELRTQVIDRTCADEAEGEFADRFNDALRETEAKVTVRQIVEEPWQQAEQALARAKEWFNEQVAEFAREVEGAPGVVNPPRQVAEEALAEMDDAFRRRMAQAPSLDELKDWLSGFTATMVSGVRLETFGTEIKVSARFSSPSRGDGSSAPAPSSGQRSGAQPSRPGGSDVEDAFRRQIFGD